MNIIKPLPFLDSFITTRDNTKKTLAKVTEVTPLANNILTVHLSFESDFVAEKGQYLLFIMKDEKGRTHRVPVTIINDRSDLKVLVEDVEFDPEYFPSLLSSVKKEDSVEVRGPSNKPFLSERKYSQVVFAVLACVAMFFLSVSVGRYYLKYPKTDFQEAVSLSSSGADQKPIQDFLVSQVKSGVNDDKTKQAMYLIAHRFFDNGGDIYEIYNFVNSHDEVSFLKEAEKIEPEAFGLIKSKKVSRYDGPSTIALLSYFEIAHMHGYANLAMLGTAANKYAELAYNYRRFSDTFGRSTSTMDKKEKLGLTYVAKSFKFSKWADELIKKETGGTYDLKKFDESDALAEDTLIGLNQFASAQAFYSGMGEISPTKFSASEVFIFNSDFARRKVPRLYLFTNYLWATSYIYSGNLNSFSVAAPLLKVIEYGNANKQNPRPAGSLLRIINSKTNGERSVFSHENAAYLAKTYKPFKDFLVANGWTDKDFILPK